MEPLCMKSPGQPQPGWIHPAGLLSATLIGSANAAMRGSFKISTCQIKFPLSSLYSVKEENDHIFKQGGETTFHPVLASGNCSFVVIIIFTLHIGCMG